MKTSKPTSSDNSKPLNTVSKYPDPDNIRIGNSGQRLQVIEEKILCIESLDTPDSSHPKIISAFTVEAFIDSIHSSIERVKLKYGSGCTDFGIQSEGLYNGGCIELIFLRPMTEDEEARYRIIRDKTAASKAASRKKVEARELALLESLSAKYPRAAAAHPSKPVAYRLS